MLLHIDRGWIPSRAAGQSNLRPQWEFYAVLKGQCGPILDPAYKPQELKEKTLWVFAPECGHRWTCPRNQAFHRIVLHFAFVPYPLDKIVREKGYLTKALDDGEAKQLERIATELESHFLRPAPEVSTIYENLLRELATIALAHNYSRVQPAVRGDARQKVTGALAWYGERLNERPSIAEVAGAVGLSSRQLRCLFRQVQNANPKILFQQLRLEQARELLRQPELTLDQIARRCGYASASHLCREHKNLLDRSPRQTPRALEISPTEAQTSRAEARRRLVV